MFKLIITSIFFLFLTPNLYAYLGPGIGGGIIMATIGILIAIIVGLIGLIWFPLKKLFVKMKMKKKSKKKVD